LKVVLAGGGTGGHVYPALAAGEALRAASSSPVDLLYAGIRGRMDEPIVRAAGIPFEAVSAGPLRVRSPGQLVRSLWRLAAGTLQAWRLLGRVRPAAVFATGGYTSVPVGIAARLRRRPVIVYLPDVRPGWAVRLLARIATRIATTTDRSLEALPRGKAVVTGYPVRPQFWTVDRMGSRQALGLPDDAQVLLVTGASQGARRLNEAIAAQLEDLLAACHILHLTGRADEGRMRERRKALPANLRGRYHVLGYTEDMAGAMAAADLALARAGASTLGELPAAALPAILVPGVYEGWDQSPNARYLEEHGVAVVLSNERLDELTPLVQELFSDSQRLDAMRAASRALAKPDAAAKIAQLILEAAA
jgi:UDP-N-acetylglucosamine--N-acetylmuramyl-(pentapeptide) pyrophosphoryl-undecaprenol N-acetylglucosamine transferase